MASIRPWSPSRSDLFSAKSQSKINGLKPEVLTRKSSTRIYKPFICIAWHLSSNSCSFFVMRKISTWRLSAAVSSKAKLKQMVGQSCRFLSNTSVWISLSTLCNVLYMRIEKQFKTSSNVSLQWHGIVRPPYNTHGIWEMTNANIRNLNANFMALD